MDRPQVILVTGATGYIGGRLVPRLIQEGFRVRVFVRSPARARLRSWSNQVEVAVGDALRPNDISKVLEGVDTAYSLIHSMSQGSTFHELDVRAARVFGRAARRSGVERIIYLGGLGDAEANMSWHLRSRQETGCSWLQFRLVEAVDGTTAMEPTAAFIPKGLAGLAY